MKTFLLLSATALLAAAGLAQNAPQNVAGTITNGTLAQPLAHAEVTLLQLQGGMQPVGQTQTDAKGGYRFSQASGGPFMIEVDFAGVPYFAQVAAGQTETNLEVFNATDDAKKMLIDAEIAVVQPENGQLAIVDEYRVENDLQPRATLYAANGIFRFRVPAGALLDGAHIEGPGGMPVEGQPKPTADKLLYRLDFPFRPGETKIQVAYRIPYPGLKAAIRDTPIFTTNHYEVYVPTPMSFQGAGFAPVGEQQGYQVYGIPSGAIPATLTYSVSGDAPMPASPAGAAGGAGAAPGGQPGAAAPAPAPAASAEPPAKTFVERNLWAMLIILGIAAAGGLGILFARPATAPAGAPLPQAPAGGAFASDDELKRLKDDLFLLEVRRHTGHLAEADYQRERAALNDRLDRLAGK